MCCFNPIEIHLMTMMTTTTTTTTITAFSIPSLKPNDVVDIILGTTLDGKQQVKEEEYFGAV
jgi:hypothetical protein